MHVHVCVGGNIHWRAQNRASTQAHECAEFIYPEGRGEEV